MTQVWWVECFECGFDVSGTGWCWDGTSLKGVELEWLDVALMGFGVRVFGNFEIK